MDDGSQISSMGLETPRSVVVRGRENMTVAGRLGRREQTWGTQLAADLARPGSWRVPFSRPLLELCKSDGGSDQSLPLLPTSTPLWSRNDDIIYQPLLLLRESLRSDFFPFLVAFPKG